MNPGDKLIPWSLSSSQSSADQSEEHIERAASVRTHRDCAAHRDFTYTGNVSGKELAFPAFRYVDGELPGIWRVRLIAPEFTGVLIHRAIESMAINGSCAGIQPDRRRLMQRGDNFVQEQGRIDP